MKSFFKYVLASIIGTILSGIVLFFLFIAIIAGMSKFGKKDKVEVTSNSVLYINLENGISERTNSTPFPFMNQNNSLGLASLTQKIENAAIDNKIKGVYIKMGGANNIVTLGELKEALHVLKDSGKFVYAYSNNIGNGSAYLGSVADKFYVGKSGTVNITGVGMYIVFYKGLLDKLGVKMQIFKTGDFKSYGETYASKKLSEPNKLQLKRMADILQSNMEKSIAKNRNVNVEELKAKINNLEMVSVENAIKYGIIDGVRYADEVSDELKEKLKLDKDDKLNFISINKYTFKNKKSRKNKIAVLYAVGNIVDKSEGNDDISFKEMKKAIRRIRKDKSIKAVVLRINSPGGSAMASEQIYRELTLLAKEKPIIASMGGVAASGGYYIAMAADTIVASKNTITGSIGVIMMSANTKELMENNLGLNHETVNSRNYSDFGNSNRTMTKKESEVIQKYLSITYNQFTDRVEKGRKLDSVTVSDLAGGRVWIGSDAINNKLVDLEGGLKKALAIAAEKADLTEYRIANYPKKDSNPFKALFQAQTPDITSNISKSIGIDKSYLETIRNIKNINSKILMRLPYEIIVK